MHSRERVCEALAHRPTDRAPAHYQAHAGVTDALIAKLGVRDQEELLRDFGDRLTFHGGVDTQTVLPFGTPADVRAEVRRFRALTRDRGGYVLAASQEFIEDIPLDNILAMYDENLRLG